jgi:hypothetical protein
VEYSQSIEIPGVPTLDVKDEEDEHGKLKNRFEDVPVKYRPVETRIAVHHKLMMQAIQRCIEKDRGRTMIFAPPGSSKSTYGPVIGSSWAMGKWPGFQVILASYATSIAAKQSRKVRSITKDPRYSCIWAERPTLADDQRAVDDWQLSNGSSMMAAGLLAGITGNRCDFLVLDDPVANREQADSPTLREKTYNEYIDTAMTRAKPKMSVLIIQCMTGDTPVRMASGVEKPLRNIKQGDWVESYDKGVIRPAKVLNWANQGYDNLLSLAMESGRIVRANKRHPFLVDRNGKREWLRMENLGVGDLLVGVNGVASCAVQTPATETRCAEDFAQNTTPATVMPGEFARQVKCQNPTRAGMPNLNTDTVLLSKNITTCCAPKTGDVLYAGNFQEKMSGRIGAADFVSITSTKAEKSGGCFATTATCASGTEKQPTYYETLPITYTIALDKIISIIPAGREEVFDIQVEGTENFIANGLVSHNTRWHEEDLSGSILPTDYNGESGMIKCRDGQTWEVLCIPAEAEREDDVLGRKIGDFLWPEWFPREHWSTWRDNPRAARTWAALYQQRPAPFTGVHFNREMFRLYDPDLARVDI